MTHKYTKLFLIFLLAGSTLAFSRAGGGRSSSGSSRSRSGPSRNYSEPRREAPPSQQQRQQQAAPSPQQQAAPQQPSFMRNMLGGMAGGFLGSALFSSLGFGRGMGGGAGGGIGFLDILLLAGGAYLLFRFFRNRQQSEVFSTPAQTPYSEPTIASTGFRALQTVEEEKISRDEASDIFFKIQTAWSKRDLTRVKDFLSTDIDLTFSEDIAKLVNAHRINKLENIAVRDILPIEAWTEDNVHYSRTRITASILDYVVDESTGTVVDGNDQDPVRFDEEWTFQKTPSSSHWQLCEIAQP